MDPAILGRLRTSWDSLATLEHNLKVEECSVRIYFNCNPWEKQNGKKALKKQNIHSQWICATSLLKRPLLLKKYWRGSLCLNTGEHQTERDREPGRLLCTIIPPPHCARMGSPVGEEWHPLILHHFAEHAHRLYDISQVSAYNGGAQLCEKDPPDVCDLLQLDLVFPTEHFQPGLARTFQTHFYEAVPEMIWLIEVQSF